MYLVNSSEGGSGASIAFLTDSDMPKGFFPRTFAGIADIFQPGKDRDKRGNFPNPFATLSE